jgi:hypothetical protein
VRCFETLVDISEPIYLERIIPGTRHTISLRDLDPKNVLAQNACLDGGAEALVMQWKLLMSEPLKRGDNLEAPKPVPLNANLDALHRADANLPILNPIQRLNDEDTHEWNLFTRYIPSDLRSNRHSLSDILRNWQYSVVSLHPPAPRTNERSELNLFVAIVSRECRLRIPRRKGEARQVRPRS